jgi:predicted phosphodiesterase
VSDLPRNGTLLGLARRFPTDQALANHLTVPRTTLRDHINRLGMREAVNAVRERPEVVRPDEIPIIYRDYSDQDKHYIYPLGDVHLGAKQHNADMWREWLEYLHDRKAASLLATGDMLNTAILGSKSDVYDEQMTVGEAKRAMRAQLTPLAQDGRIDAMVPGNHEHRITAATGDCPIQDICDSLTIPYIEAAALIVYRVGDVEYEVYLRHGTGNGQALASLAKAGTVIRADVYVTGHIHRQAATVEDFFVRKGSAVQRERRHFVSSGSFLGYEKYAAVRGYSPGRLGAPRIFLDGRRHDIHISL